MKAWLKEDLPWIVIGLSLGWLSSWSSNSIDAFRAIVLGLLAGTAGLVVMRANSAPSISLGSTALLTVAFVVGVWVGESTWVMQVKWSNTNLTACQLARASFSKTFTIPAGATSCPASDSTTSDTTKKTSDTTKAQRDTAKSK